MFENGLWKKYLVAVGVLFGIAYLFYGHLWIGCGLLPLLIFYGKILRRQEEHRQLGIYTKAFGDFLQIVETGLTAGYSLEHVLEGGAEEMKKTCSDDCQIVLDLLEIKKRLVLHTPVQVCLQDWADKKGIEEMNLFAHIVSAGRLRGGDLNKIIRQTAESISKRLEGEEEIRTMLAGKYLEYRIMCVMPLGILAYIRIGSQNYFDCLYNNIGGIVFMTICLVVYGLGVWLGERWIRVVL